MTVPNGAGCGDQSAPGPVPSAPMTLPSSTDKTDRQPSRAATRLSTYRG